MSEPFITLADGTVFCDEERALADLLAHGVLFCNERDCLFDGEPCGSTTVLYVLCNDVFAWGAADAEDLPNDEIGTLWKMWNGDKRWGGTKWCIRRRSAPPQPPVEAKMKADGSWDEEMQAIKDKAAAKEGK